MLGSDGWWCVGGCSEEKILSNCFPSLTQALPLSSGPRRALVGPPHPLMPPSNGAPERGIDPPSAKTPYQSLTLSVSLCIHLCLAFTLPSFFSLPFCFFCYFVFFGLSSFCFYNPLQKLPLNRKEYPFVTLNCCILHNQRQNINKT